MSKIPMFPNKFAILASILGVGIKTALVPAYEDDMNALIADSVPQTQIYYGYYLNGTSEKNMPTTISGDFYHAAFISFNCGNGAGIQIAVPYDITLNKVAYRSKWSNEWSSCKLIGGA